MACLFYRNVYTCSIIVIFVIRSVGTWICPDISPYLPPVCNTLLNESEWSKWNIVRPVKFPNSLRLSCMFCVNFLRSRLLIICDWKFTLHRGVLYSQNIAYISDHWHSKPVRDSATKILVLYICQQTFRQMALYIFHPEGKLKKIETNKYV